MYARGHECQSQYVYQLEVNDLSETVYQTQSSEIQLCNNYFLIWRKTSLTVSPA